MNGSTGRNGSSAGSSTTAWWLLKRAAELLSEAERLSEAAGSDSYLMSSEKAALQVARAQAAATIAQAYTALATATASTGQPLRSRQPPWRGAAQ